MAFKLANRVKMTVSGAPGTGSITLGSAITGYVSFATGGIVDGDTVSYVIEDGSNWEIGVGTYTASGTVLARTTVTTSSAGGTTKISVTSAALVFIAPLAADLSLNGLPGSPLTVVNGGTGLTSLTAGYIPFGNGTNAFGSSITLFWDNANSRLGLGTTTPAYTLDVYAYQSRIARSTSGYAQSIISNTGGNLSLGLENSAGGTLLTGASAYSGVINVTGNYALAFATNNTLRMVLSAAGNLGVGVSSPAYKLDIAGTGHFTGAVTLDTALTVANGGTGATDAATARTNLGLGTAATHNVGTDAGDIVQLNASGQLPAVDGSLLTGISSASKGIFHKADITSVVFIKTGAGTVSIKAGATIVVGTTTVAFAADTAVTMPALTAGTDYAIYACADGSLVASSSFTAPAGYTTANSRQIGGFHYAPGGNATARAGGNTTPAINEYSLWDLKWRPSCLDPRGMTLVAGGFWCDIYLLGVDHQINGTSKNAVTIADGASPPKLPAVFGGNGSTTYSTLTWFESAEIMRAYGKRLLSYDEFAAAAYGTTEAVSRNSVDANTTGLNTSNANQDERFTSKWGVIQSTGVMWAWGANLGGPYTGAGWTANTNGRGQTYYLPYAALFGGAWDSGAICGSRASYWSFSPTYSYSSFGARGCCDHLILV